MTKPSLHEMVSHLDGLLPKQEARSGQKFSASFCDAEHLITDHFNVFIMDRRGRCERGDHPSIPSKKNSQMLLPS